MFLLLQLPPKNYCILFATNHVPCRNEPNKSNKSNREAHPHPIDDRDHHTKGFAKPCTH